MSSRSAREIKSDKRGMAQEKKKLRSAKKEIPPPTQPFLRFKQIISQSGRRPIFKRLIHFSIYFLGCSIDRFLIEPHRSVSSGVVELVLRVQLGVKSKGQKTRFDRLFFVVFIFFLLFSPNFFFFIRTPPAESLPNRSSGQDPIGDTQCQIVGVVSLIELPVEPTCHLNFSFAYKIKF